MLKNMCGTSQRNQAGNPEVVISTKLKKGESCQSKCEKKGESCQKDFVIIMKRKDRRNILINSTTHVPGIDKKLIQDAKL